MPPLDLAVAKIVARGGPERNMLPGTTILSIDQIVVTSTTATLAALLATASSSISPYCKQINIIPATAGLLLWSLAASGDPTLTFPFANGAEIPFKVASAAYLRLKVAGADLNVQIIQEG